jgi:invasion protein IalB
MECEQPMPPIRSRLVLAAVALALAAPVAAQEAPAADAPAAPAPAAPEPAAPAAPPADGQPAPAEGQPAPADGQAAPAGAAPQGDAAAQPQQPEVMEVVKDTFGDWQVRCAPDGEECFMYQLALDAQKNPVAEVSILKLPASEEADAGVTVVTPLGTLLTNGVILQIDGGETRQYPFGWCSRVGCFARFGLAPASVDGMKRGKAGKITLLSVNAPQTPVTLDLSLTGFTDAYNSLALPPDPAPAQAAPQAQPRPAPLPTLEPRN